MSAVTVRASSNAQPPGSSTTWTIPFPGTPQVGDPVGIWITTDGNTNTISAPAGWTLEYNTTVGSGSRHFLHKVYASGDGASVGIPLNTAWGAGHGKAAVVVLDGSVHGDFGPIGTVTSRSTSSTTSTALATGSSAAPNLIVFHEKTTSQTSCVVTGATDIQNVLPNTGIAGSVYVGTYDDAAGTSTFTAQYGLTGNTNGAGYQIPVTLKAVSGTVTLSGSGSLTVTGAPAFAATVALSGSGTLGVTAPGTISGTATLSGAGALTVTGTPSIGGAVLLAGAGTLSAHGTAPIDLWLAQTPLYIAHRGGSADWDQSTMFAYDQAATWSATVALEAPVWKSADGVWVINHDNDPSTTGTWANPGTGNITTRNWAGDLQNIVSSGRGSPMIRLIDLLVKYGASRIIWIENKGSIDVTGWLNLLDSYAGAARYVVKQYYDNAAVAAAAHARGYKTWGYYYDADAANLPSTAANWDILGMQYNASSASWAAANSYGKPVVAHIVATAAQKATATANGAAGYMSSGVEEVVPQTPALAALSGAGTLTVTGTPSIGGAVPFAGAGTLSVSTGPVYSGTVALAGGGALAVTGTPVVAATVAYAGSGILSISGAPSIGGMVALTGAGQLIQLSDIRDITVLVDGPFRHPLAVTGPTRNPLTVSGATT